MPVSSPESIQSFSVISLVLQKLSLLVRNILHRLSVNILILRWSIHASPPLLNLLLNLLISSSISSTSEVHEHCHENPRHQHRNSANEQANRDAEESRHDHIAQDAANSHAEAMVTVAAVNLWSTGELGCAAMETEVGVAVSGNGGKSWSEAEFTHAAVSESAESGHGSSAEGGEFGGHEGADAADDCGAGVGGWVGVVWSLFDGKESVLAAC